MVKTKKSSLEKVLSGIQIKTQSKVKRDLLEWIDYHGILIKVGGRIVKFSLEGHEYLRELYEEHAPDEVLRKGAQVGASIRCVLKSLWLADQYALKVLYYFPTDDAIEDFSVDRLDPMINNTHYLRDRVQEAQETGGAFNRGLKHLGESTIYMRGMFTKLAVKTVDGDYLILDEVDEANQENRIFAFDRITHSFLQWTTELSQPSIQDFGVDKSFGESDQRYWLLICPACGEYNHLDEDFPKHFMRTSGGPASRQGGQKYYRGCIKCCAALDMARGEWVAKYRERSKRGYHLSQLYTQIVPQGVADPADRIMREYQSARRTFEKKRFMISIRGYPYAGDRQPVTDKVLDNCEAVFPMQPGAALATGMGVDVGDVLHIVIRGRDPATRIPRIIWIEATEDWGRLGKLMQEFFVPVCVIDAMPYKSSAKHLALAFKGRVYLQYFKEREQVTSEGEEEKEVPVVHVDRTESLDDTTQEFRDQGIEIPAMKSLEGEQLAWIEEFRRHLKNLVKDLEENSRGTTVAIYKRGVENHFGMAANSARIAEGLSAVTAFSGTLPVFGRL